MVKEMGERVCGRFQPNGDKNLVLEKIVIRFNLSALIRQTKWKPFFFSNAMLYMLLQTECT